MKKINEIFYSLQGEGANTGTPAVFVRFAGCNIKCSFCDTKHQEGREMSREDIVEEVVKYPTNLVVITGGEPGLQVDSQLIDMLHNKGKYVAIETNGTCVLPENIDWVTCSPKQGGKLKIKHIDELKLVYLGEDVSYFLDIPAKEYYLQPCSGENTEEVINYILEHPQWKLSLQTHKLLNIQ